MALLTPPWCHLGHACLPTLYTRHEDATTTLRQVPSHYLPKHYHFRYWEVDWFPGRDDQTPTTHYNAAPSLYEQLNGGSWFKHSYGDTISVV